MNKLYIRLHLTNVAGLGATQLMSSLLPSIEANSDYFVEAIYLPNRGVLSTYKSECLMTAIEVYKRFIPNAISRVLECVFFAGRFNGKTPLLVFGDLPLFCNSRQTLFVQTPNLLKPAKFQLNLDGIKYWISRLIFRLGAHRVDNFIVQTVIMREALESSFSTVLGRVHVISQPVPKWLLSSALRRVGRVGRELNALRLIYPSAGYPHKNHLILSLMDSRAVCPVGELTLTISEESNPAPHLPWIHCTGILSTDEIIKFYSQVDALLFLSKEESYGFPLVEAMYVGLPIVCPDLPYARVLCGEDANYFDPDDPESLLYALRMLKDRLDQGWWPNWKNRLSNIPKDWDGVAKRMLEIASGRFSNLSG
jgi:glycosyltransferase involved in cell wall biosynthesis